ncbi:MAG: hypothetical protein ACK5QC_04195 [Bacteroidota bacterium]|jgi:hypothetical protein
MKPLKICFLFILFVTFSTTNAQDKYMLKSKLVTEIKLQGSPFGPTKVETDIVSYERKIMSIIENVGFKQIQLIDGEAKTMEIKDGNNCVKTTADEIKAENEKQKTLMTLVTKYENVNVYFSNETRKILNYACKKVVITYDVVTQNLNTKTQTTEEIWYCEEIVLENNSNSEDVSNININEYSINSSNVKNEVLGFEELQKAYNQIKGTVLEKFITAGPSKMSTTISKVLKNPSEAIVEKEFKVVSEGCSKNISLKEYKKIIKKRQEAESRLMNSLHR